MTNSALYRDSCLYIVPGSHSVPRTAEQRKHSETLEPPVEPLAMPGSIQLKLQRKSSNAQSRFVPLIIALHSAGETVFYNSNILHCATYSTREKRATLHGSMGDARGGASRARNVLQHGLEWMLEKRFRDGLDGRGQTMLDRLIAMRDSLPTVEVGYSLLD